MFIFRKKKQINIKVIDFCVAPDTTLLVLRSDYVFIHPISSQIVFEEHFGQIPFSRYYATHYFPYLKSTR